MSKKEELWEDGYPPPTKHELSGGFVPRLRGERAYLRDTNPILIGTLTGLVGMGSTLEVVLDDPTIRESWDGSHRAFKVGARFDRLVFLNERVDTSRMCNDLVPCPSCGKVYRLENGRTNMNHDETCSTPRWGTPPDWNDLTNVN